MWHRWRLFRSVTSGRPSNAFGTRQGPHGEERVFARLEPWEYGSSFETRPRAAPQDEVIIDRQLLAPVTWASALWLMVVPIWDSSLVTYSATCSSLKPRSRVSFNFLMSSEARST